MQHHENPTLYVAAKSYKRSKNPNCVGKRQMPEEIDALMVLASIQKKDSSTRTKMEKRHYECEHCKHWHLTSWERPPIRRESAPEPAPIKPQVVAPDIEDGLLALLNEMFLRIGATEEYNAGVAKRIQREVDSNPSLIERIIKNEIQSNYMDGRAADIIAEVVVANIK